MSGRPAAAAAGCGGGRGGCCLSLCLHQSTVERGLHHGEAAGLVRHGGVAPLSGTGTAVLLEIGDDIIKIVLLKILSSVQQKHQRAVCVAGCTAGVVPIEVR